MFVAVCPVFLWLLQVQPLHWPTGHELCGVPSGQRLTSRPQHIETCPQAGLGLHGNGSRREEGFGACQQSDDYQLCLELGGASSRRDTDHIHDGYTGMYVQWS